MENRKRHRTAYVLDESKLRRIHGILEQQFERLGEPFSFTFETSHRSRRTVVLDDVEELLKHDNPVKAPIISLRVTCTSTPETPADSDKPQWKAEQHASTCEIQFDDAETFPSVVLRVETPHTDWGHALHSLLDEQIERTYQSGLIPRIKASIFGRFLPILGLGTLPVPVSLLVLYAPEESLRRSMWLTADQVRRLATQPEVTPAEVTAMQIANLANAQTQGIAAVVMDWRVLFAACPVLLIVGCSAYLYFWCYPTTVFNWGDMGERYAATLNRRKLVWGTVIIGLVIGLVTNVAVYGIVGLSGH